MIFDLDPAGKADFKDVQKAAKKIKDLLDALNLKSMPILIIKDFQHLGILQIKKLMIKQTSII